MKIFLVGYMASGKSRYGRTLAEEKGLRFIDLDHYIEDREHRTIREIFATFGEEEFRRLESNYLREVVMLYKDFVLSCGGGTPCFNDNMEFMNSEGMTIFLNPSVDELTRRLIRNRKRRPLVANLSDDEVKAFVEKHLNERMPFYSKAKTIIVNDE